MHKVLQVEIKIDKYNNDTYVAVTNLLPHPLPQIKIKLVCPHVIGVDEMFL